MVRENVELQIENDIKEMKIDERELADQNSNEILNENTKDLERDSETLIKKELDHKTINVRALSQKTSSNDNESLNKITLLEEENKDILLENEELKEEIKAFKRNQLTHIEEITQLKDHQHNLQKSIEEYQCMIQNLQTRIKELEREQEDYQNRFQELGTQLAFAIGEKATQTAQLNQAQVNSNLLKKKNQELQENLHQSYQDKYQLAEQMNKLQVQYQDLNQSYLNIKNTTLEKDQLLSVLADEMAKSKWTLKELSLKQQHEKSLRDEIHLWVDDSLAAQCTKCNTPFSLVVRKHHCRRDGKVYCGPCTNYKAVLPASRKPKRVCVDCYNMLKEGGSQEVYNRSESKK
ncbi:FYVE-domain-containing protein [Neoconidiobolus thromboides FSU 785]|nr:FYVE-domain-containing protein [Neoconidiobolus thromboides FSU 785]